MKFKYIATITLSLSVFVANITTAQTTSLESFIGHYVDDANEIIEEFGLDYNHLTKLEAIEKSLLSGEFSDNHVNAIQKAYDFIVSKELYNQKTYSNPDAVFYDMFDESLPLKNIIQSHLRGSLYPNHSDLLSDLKETYDLNYPINSIDEANEITEAILDYDYEMILYAEIALLEFYGNNMQGLLDGLIEFRDVSLVEFHDNIPGRLSEMEDILAKYRASKNSTTDIAVNSLGRLSMFTIRDLCFLGANIASMGLSEGAAIAGATINGLSSIATSLQTDSDVDIVSVGASIASVSEGKLGDATGAIGVLSAAYSLFKNINSESEFIDRLVENHEMTDKLIQSAKEMIQDENDMQKSLEAFKAEIDDILFSQIK